MYRILLALSIALLLVVTPGRAYYRDDEDDTSEIEGLWQVTQRLVSPGDPNNDVAKLLTEHGFDVEIKNGKIFAKDAAKAGKSEFRLKLKKRLSPLGVDLLKKDDDDFIVKGIITVDDIGIMTMLFGTDGTRPTEDDATNTVKLLLRRKPAGNGGN